MGTPSTYLEYSGLQLIELPKTIIYGPIQSKRLGESLGINLLGSDKKICNYDCSYCELGRTEVRVNQLKKHATFPTVDEVVNSLRDNLVQLTKDRVQISTITVSGNGEPTLHPEFAEVVPAILKVRDELLPKLQVGILTNGALLATAKILRAVNMLDLKMVKIDCGSDSMLAKINAPLVRQSAAKLIQGAKKVSDLIVQTIFLNGEIDNTSKNEIDEWIEVVGMVKPKLVHIYTLNRVPPVSGLRQVPPQKLKEIGEILKKRTQIPSLVFS